MELYAEHSVTNSRIDGKAKKWAILKAIRMVRLAIAAAGFMFFALLALLQETFPAMGVMLVVGAALFAPFVAISLLIRRQVLRATMEYDYFVIGGKFRIVKVLRRTKRKMMTEIPFSDFQSVGKADSEAHARYATSKDIKKLVAIGNFDDDSNIYYGYYVREGVKTLLYFEPSAEFMIAFKRSLPRVSIMDKSALGGQS